VPGTPLGEQSPGDLSKVRGAALLALTRAPRVDAAAAAAAHTRSPPPTHPTSATLRAAADAKY